MDVVSLLSLSAIVTSTGLMAVAFRQHSRNTRTLRICLLYTSPSPRDRG